MGESGMIFPSTWYAEINEVQGPNKPHTVCRGSGNSVRSHLHSNPKPVPSDRPRRSLPTLSLSV
jgi:hypothetical protein